MGKRGKMKAITFAELKAGAASMSKRQLKNQRQQLRRENIRDAIELRNNSLPSIDWTSLNLPPIKKDVYKEYVKTSNLSPKEVDEYRKEKLISVKGAAPNPITDFAEVGFPQFCMEKLLANYKEPTPVQAQIWPIAMKGHNIVCIANNDKGSILAFLLPAILHIRAQPPPTPKEGSIVLILSPNYQSVEIIKAVVQEYVSGASISFTCLGNGGLKEDKIQDVARGHHIIIATPSRVAAFLKDGHINFKRCTFVILNEADRMLNSELQVNQVLSQIRPDRQILMLVTTTQPSMPVFVEDFFDDYIEISVQAAELIENSSVIKQHVDVGEEIDKGPKLKDILLKIYADEEPLRRGKIMIFAATKRRVDRVRKFITSFLKYCSAVHSDKNKADRALMLKDFTIGKTDILVTTDSSDPDIIVDKIRYVINFDHPLDPNNYLRRLRRIDPGMFGQAFTFFTRKDAIFAQQLINDLRKTKQFVSKELLHMARLGSDPTKNSTPIYYSRMKSGLTVHKNNLPSASGNAVAGGSGTLANNDGPESDSDAEDMSQTESAGGRGFESRKNDNEFDGIGTGSGYGSNTSSNRGSSGFDFGKKREDKGFGGGGLRAGGGGLLAGGGTGFGKDSGGFRENSGAIGFGYEGGASGSSGGGGRDSRAGSGFGLHVGSGSDFSNMGNDIGFSNRGGGSGFGIEGDLDRVSSGALAGDTVRFRNTAFDGIGNGRGFGIDDGENVRELGSRGYKNRFGDIGGDRSVGMGYHNRDGDAISSRNSFASERDHDSRGDHDFNKRNDDYFSSNFVNYDNSEQIVKGLFNKEQNGNFNRRGTDSSFGGRGDDCYNQGNNGLAQSGGFAGSGGFAESGGDRAKGYSFSDAFDNHNNRNFRDGRGDGGFRNQDDRFNRRENDAFNNKSDSELNKREDFSSGPDTLFMRRDVRHFNNTSRWGGYSGDHDSNRNIPYNPQSGGCHGRDSGYGK